EGSFAMNSVEIIDLPTISVGLTDLESGDYEIIDCYDPENYVYKKVVLDDGRIVGLILINEIDRAGIYTGLIKKRIEVSSFKDHLLSEDFGLVHLPEEYRNYLLSGEGLEL
ncbi:pyridine nucleotide-disulfide oxidoreductase, partial [candidate division MSBL1 archaeon SCGC-AAA382N08]